jgi:hypothetical protein
MKSAIQTVALLLENEIVRVCSACDKNHEALGKGRVQVAPGQMKGHGICRRHQIKLYGDYFAPGEIEAMPDDKFCPDLGEPDAPEPEAQPQ